MQSSITEAGLITAKNRYITTEAIARELNTIAIMESGQGQADVIASDLQINQMLMCEQTLTKGQRRAIQTTAQSRDQVMAWQGVAGAGETYSLKLLAQLATEQGYAVTGYAPSAEAATVLQTEANIESATVARLLHSRQSEAAEKAIWIVDEAGLLSAKDAHALLAKAQAEKARVILVGDTRQLSAVEAGNPFKSLQSAGMQTAYLEESRRQKTDALRTAVVCLAAGEPREGLEQLDRAGMVHQVESREGRHHAICRDYLNLSPEAREKTLILSGTNVERLALTAELRAALQADGSLGADAFTLRSLRPLDRTASQLQYACAYEVGDVVVPVRDYHRYGMERRVQYRVIDRDLESNRLTLTGPDGESFSFDPATCATKTTYAVQEIAISPGDQLRWTRNEAVPGVRNGQTVTVEAIDAKGTATVRGARGETMTLELTGQQYLDYALVSTTYSSQGKTADQVLADIDSTLSKEGLYVAVSRAKSNLKLYTADKPQLYKRAQRSAAKENPSDYLPLFEMVTPDAQSEKAAADTREVRGADQSEYLGDRAGERVAVGHRAAVRGDSAAQSRSEPATERAGRVTPEYVSDVRGVVAGIEERRQAAELEGQAKRLGEAADAIVSGAGQLELTAGAVDRLNGAFEQKAERRLNSVSAHTIGQGQSVQADGVAEVILSKIAPDDLARYQAQMAKPKVPEPLIEKRQTAEREDKRHRRRQVYQQYAAKFEGKSVYECDRLVVCELMSDLLTERGGQKLRDDEIGKVDSILLQGLVAQQLKQTRGKETGVTYAMEVLAKAQKVVEKTQRRSRDQGMER